MTGGASRGWGAQLGDWLAFTGYLQATSDWTPSECLAALEKNQGRSRLFGGYRTRLVLPKSSAGPKGTLFEMEYYRLHYESGRPSYMVQRLRGVLVQEDGQTVVAAKVRFTGATLRWLWLGMLLTLVSVGLLFYTGNVVTFVLIAMTGGFMLAMAASMWLDRYRLVRQVRNSIGG